MDAPHKNAHESIVKFLLICAHFSVFTRCPRVIMTRRKEPFLYAVLVVEVSEFDACEAMAHIGLPSIIE